MRVPSYPSNREADEHAMKPLRKREGACGEKSPSGFVIRALPDYRSRMKPSRETCLHRDYIIPLGVGYAMG